MSHSFPLPARVDHDRHRARRHGFDCRHAKMFLQRGLLTSRKTIAGGMPIKGRASVKITQRVEFSVEVEKNGAPSGGIFEASDKCRRFLKIGRASCRERV